MNLKQLSEILGLSQTTVSRALNGYPEVSEQTRQRVLDTAREHNYSPNQRAMSLATGRSMTIGHVIPTSTQHEMVNPIFGDFVSGACEEFSLYGYDMLFSRVNDDDQASQYMKLKRKGVVDGLVLQGPSVDEPRIGVLNKLGLPFVVHGRASGVSEPYAWVDVNNRRSFLQASNYLLDLGHRRIALINGLESMDFARRRRAGYIDALQQRGIAIDESLISSAEMTEENGYSRARALLMREQPPTAILASSLITAIGVRRAIEERGLKMAQDVSVLTHDDDLSYLRNGQAKPIFTATRSSVRKAGQICAQILIERIQQPEGRVVQRLLESELVIGASTGPCPV